MAISNKTGSPVSGDDFFDREWEFKQLIKSIRAQEHILISAPRRVGKSSLMKKALSWSQNKGYIAVDADVQDCKDESDFLEVLAEAFRKSGIKPGWLSNIYRQINALRDWLNGIKINVSTVGLEFSESLPPEWRQTTNVFDELFEKLVDNNKKVLVGMDELPIFLSRIMKMDSEGGAIRVDVILHWLRSIRQKHPQIVWIICGSIGLDTFAEQHNLVGAINDLRLQRLGAFSDQDARTFLRMLGESPKNPLKLGDEIIDYIVEKVGWPLPYFLQLVFQVIDEMPPDKRSAEYPSAEDVDNACESLYGAGYSKYFAHWVKRLDDQLSVPDVDAATAILNAVSRYKEGLSRNKLLQVLIERQPNADVEKLEKQLAFLLDVLERDGYFLRANSIYAFRSFVLREFWKRRS
jgi:hypothetical protein